MQAKPRGFLPHRGIALALGGGGVKGYAHLGFLSVLEEAGMPVVAVAGTSIGAWVGALFAAGKPAREIFEWFRSLPPDIIRERRDADLPAYWGFGGFARALQAYLAPLTRIEELPIPFGAVAVDLFQGRVVYLTQGPLVEALLASAALPGVFPPIQWGRHTLLDGGVLDNVPVRLARWLAPRRPVVAVVLSARPHEIAARPLPRVAERIPFLGGLLNRWAYVQAMAFFLRAVELSGTAMTFLRLTLDRPEVTVTLPVADVSTLDRHVDAEELWERGRRAAQEALPHIRRALRFWWRAWLFPPQARDLKDVLFLPPP